MKVDLLHNKIVAETASAEFCRCVEEELLPLISEKYGDSLLGIEMYEDYVSDAFLSLGEWYYPLTVITEAGATAEWVKWRLDEKFEGGIPYSYKSDLPIGFALCDDVPEEFVSKMAGRAIHFEGGLIRVRVESVAADPTFLSGKYSQTFIDELARQLTPKIASAMSVEGLENGALELVLTFSPETYMEHTSENITYRRLLLADKTSAPRDFWVKWTRLDGATAYSVSSHVTSENILFEIGEDVPQKVREREYRYLLRVKADKYHNAMGRKNITEWRELIKRAIRRGDLVKIERPVVISEQTFEVEKQLADILGVSQNTHTASVKEESTPELDEITRLAMAALNIPVAPVPEATELVFDEEPLEIEESEDALAYSDEESEEYGDDDEVVFVEEPDKADEIFEDESADIEIFEDEPADIEIFEDESVDIEIFSEDEPDEHALADLRALEPDEDEEIDDAEDFDDIDEYVEIDDEPEAIEEIEEAKEAPSEPVITAREFEEKIRAELEAKIRLEYESRLRAQAEEEAERLRREQELLRRENERLIAIAKREEEERARLAELQAEKEAKLKAEIEAQARRDVIERERLAEAARLAIIEERKKEEERSRVEREKLEREKKLAEDRLRQEETARIEAERAREAERIRREAAERRAEADSSAEKTPEKKTPAYVNNNYTYTSKRVKLLFRRSVDPNITSRIYEIVKATIEYYGKEKVYLKIKATIPDTESVILDFASIPMEEMELLSNIIKVLGNSGLGIAKAIVD